MTHSPSAHPHSMMPFKDAVHRLAQFVEQHLPDPLMEKPLNLNTELKRNELYDTDQVCVTFGGEAAHHASHMLQGLLKAADPEREINYEKSKPATGGRFANGAVQPVITKELKLEVKPYLVEGKAEAIGSVLSALETEQGQAAYAKVSDAVYKANKGLDKSNTYPRFKISDDGQVVPGLTVFTSKDTPVNDLAAKIAGVQTVETGSRLPWNDYQTGQRHIHGSKFTLEGTKPVSDFSDAIPLMQQGQSKSVAGMQR